MITLATLKDATEQEVFDQVYVHLLTQNERSVNELSGCSYRSGNLKCAAGCLIDDSEYRSEMDRNPNGMSGWRKLVSIGLVPDSHCYLIRRLQEVHDACDVHEWKEVLNSLAKEFNLTVPKLY